VKCWQKFQHFNSLREIMQKISVVEEFPHRDFALNKFSGDQPDKLGNKNVGAAYMAYVAQILNTAKDEGCAVVLASHTQSLMSNDAKADLIGRLLELDAVPIKTDKIRNSLGKVRSELEAKARRQEKRDAHAAKVISISQRFAARYVVLQMDLLHVLEDFYSLYIFYSFSGSLIF
jgi:vacuolar-type H+-ATPase subunit I/STV1